MSVDLARALQDFSSAVDFMRRNAQQLWDVYLNPDPKEVTIYGPDGRAIKEVPNLAKWREVIRNDAYTAMYKVLYVDAENGDDSNEGTTSKPLKTIQEAIRRIPAGGYGEINLKEGQVHQIASLIIIQSKTILLPGILIHQHVPIMLGLKMLDLQTLTMQLTVLFHKVVQFISIIQT